MEKKGNELLRIKKKTRGGEDHGKSVDRERSDKSIPVAASKGEKAKAMEQSGVLDNFQNSLLGGGKNADEDRPRGEEKTAKAA